MMLYNFFMQDKFPRVAEITKLILESDDDYPICNGCRKLGYCRMTGKPFSSIVHKQNTDIKVYSNKVPLRSGNKQLQKAYDAFHEDDFETALLLLRTAAEQFHTSAVLQDIQLTLALCYYHQKEFDNAAFYMNSLLAANNFSDHSFVDDFLHLCEKSMKAQQEVTDYIHDTAEEDAQPVHVSAREAVKLC